MPTKLLPLIIICVIIAGMVACDVTGDENIAFEQGDTLLIAGGPSSDTLPLPRYREVIDTTVTPNDTSMVAIQDTVTYSVRAYTVNKTYEWAVTPSGNENVYRNGEFLEIVVTAADTGTYAISVEDGEYQPGTASLVVVDTTTAP